MENKGDGKNIKLKYKNLTDEEIVNKINQEGGHSILIEILYDRFALRIYQKCYGLTRDKNIAKDLTHDIFIKVITKVSSFKGNSKFSLWVHSISHFHCIDYLKSKKKYAVDNLETTDSKDLDISNIESENDILIQIKAKELYGLMDALKIYEKEILLLRYQQELSIKQIAVTLNISESAVKMRLKRSRAKLATIYKKQTNE